MSIVTLEPVLDRLARFTHAPMPVVSLYLDLSADQHGRQTHDAFLERAFAEPRGTYSEDSTFRDALQLSLIHISSPRDRSLSRMPSSA